VASELDNIRAAVAWSLDAADAADEEFALRIVASFAGEANTSVSSFGVGLWAESALPAARSTTKLNLRADVVAAAAWSVLVRGDLEQARALALESLAHGLPPDMWAPSNPYVLLGYREAVLEHADAAIEVTGEGRDAVAALPGARRYELVMVSVSHAGFLAIASRGEKAALEGETALRMARELGNPSLLANALTVRVVSTWLSEPELAEPWLDEALDLVRSGASGVMFGIMLAIRAQLLLRAGDTPGARSAVREAVTYISDTGDLPQLVTVFEYAIPVLVPSSASAAAVLAGFALDGPFAALGNMPRDVWPHRDAALELARIELGDDRFRVDRAHGATLSWEHAVVHALDALDAFE
jgi:hypothetical protein